MVGSLRLFIPSLPGVEKNTLMHSLSFLISSFDCCSPTFHTSFSREKATLNVETRVFPQSTYPITNKMRKERVFP